MFPDKLEIFSNDQLALLAAVYLMQRQTTSSSAIIRVAGKFKQALDLNLDESRIKKVNEPE